jgi:universal stress protein A
MKMQPRVSDVVCAIDVNDYDQQVIDLAAEFASHFRSNLKLLHVSFIPDPVKTPASSLFGTPSVLIEDHQKLTGIQTSVPNVNIQYHHLSGIPSQKILEFAEEVQPKMLVLGTHGRTGLKRIFGSVAETVLRKAQCPVLVLRQTQKQAQET